MTATKKQFTDYTEVTNNEFTDQVPVLQTVNKVTTLQKVYNLFKKSFDNVYTTTSAVANQISSALTNYATQTFAIDAANESLDNAKQYTNDAVVLKQDKQSIDVFDIDASSGASAINVSSCILSITNIPSGTGNKTITIKVAEFALTVKDIISTSLIYGGFDVNLRSWAIFDVGGDIFLRLYINVHSSPTEPVLIAINKIN